MIKNALDSGMKVGEYTKFVGEQSFGSEPYLIEIGNNCLITDNVSFTTHDGGIQVPFIERGSDLPSVYAKQSLVGTVTLGDNVFVGTRSIFLPQTTLGDNVIVAAGSVVKGDFLSNIVIGGVPAKVICSLDEYYNKHKNNLFFCNNKILSLHEKQKLIFEHLSLIYPEGNK